MAKPFANNGDPDQMPRSAASDLGMHSLPTAFFQGYPDYNRSIKFYAEMNTKTKGHYSVHFSY